MHNFLGNYDNSNLCNLYIFLFFLIFIGPTNIEHIKSRHPYEYDKYLRNIEEIIATPDYVGMNPKDKSIAFVKEYHVASEFIRVAVQNKCYAKTLHLLSTCNAERYIRKGTLKPLTKPE